MRLTTSITALVLASGALTSATASAAQAVETCFGLTPTIVSERETVTGTQGDDVIVAKDAYRVNALGGDDTICATDTYAVWAGEGNDRVRAGARDRILVVLGPGSDLFEGTRGPARVYADDQQGEHSVPGGPSENTDTIITSDASGDKVFSGSWGEPNHDRIDLGGGSDVVVLAGAPGGTGSVDGGRGNDFISVDLSFEEGDASLALDLEAGLAALAGEQLAAIPGFENAHVLAPGHEVGVVGTSDPNEIYVVGDVSIQAGAGPDRITLHGAIVSVVGGAGRDLVGVQGYGDFEEEEVLFDLGRQLYTRAGSAPVPFETEKLDIAGTGAAREYVQVLGSPRKDVVTIGACGAVVRGKQGADRLISNAEQCGRVQVELYGGSGNDRLRGAVGRDVLIGNAGRDRADGDLGQDVCRAEVERSCERG